ncbi:MAG: DNA polymerase III subunit gamma/tau [Acidobacteria bacterium]|nr:DNA polymerase III subunit gamma/tau [Acidobacteriota bacterium]
MADATPTPTSLDGVTSLYRRFRPGRFVELRGQDHVVRALQGAVKNDRISHAYLFSGPRGTGKTTTARILAKALNCENPHDGDACNVCASCLAITKGSSLDVIELDAASNNGVDDMRDITVGAWHGTPGRWKVYIFDEVHQLSKAASAALLKTLEEPPQHVVFVLATTDPHKVLPTIRSRTQHLEFRLIAGSTLSSLLHDVQGAAGLSADAATIDAAVRLGRGSARDALSALDQLIATGSIDETQPQFDGLFHALVNEDPVEALTTLAHLRQDGWDPEQLAENFAAEVRQVFLLQVAPEVADAVDADRARLGAWGEQLGLARTVRILETFGRSMREMKSAPEKIAIFEVALVRLIRPDLDSSIDALEQRVTKLERGANRVVAVAPEPAAPTLRPIGATDSKSAAMPGARAVTASNPPTPTPPTPAAANPPAPAAPTTVVNPSTLEFDDVRDRFVQRVVPRTSRSAQLLLKSADVRALDGLRLTIALPSEEMRQNTEMISQGLRGALEHEFKVAMQVEWVVDASLLSSTPAPTQRPTRSRAPVSELPDESYSPDESSIVVQSVADHLITEMFPGAEEIS